jgi:hypothetical protein
MQLGWCSSAIAKSLKSKDSKTRAARRSVVLQASGFVGVPIFLDPDVTNMDPPKAWKSALGYLRDLEEIWDRMNNNPV